MRPPRPAPAARARAHAQRTTCWPAAPTWSPSSSACADARGRRWRERPDDAACLAAMPSPRRASSTPAAGTGGRGRSRRSHGLGFADARARPRAARFSGGELTRASLARALAGDPDLLLLDEPTNHLDIASLEWLEGYLIALDAAVILVAHDRWFLEAVGTSRARARGRPGALLPRPLARLARASWPRARSPLGKAIEKQEREIARMERFVERFRYKATKARQAQSRVKALDEDRADRARPAATRARSASASARPSAPAASCSSSRTAASRSPGAPCSRTATCGSSAASTSRWSVPTGSARPP